METKKVLADAGLHYDTPLAMMTVGQLLEVLSEKTSGQQEDSNEYLIGLRGLQSEFGISPKTASFWVNTWLRPAVERRGRIILVDKRYAHKLFDERGGRAAK